VAVAESEPSLPDILIDAAETSTGDASIPSTEVDVVEMLAGQEVDADVGQPMENRVGVTQIVSVAKLGRPQSASRRKKEEPEAAWQLVPGATAPSVAAEPMVVRPETNGPPDKPEPAETGALPPSTTTPSIRLGPNEDPRILMGKVPEEPEDSAPAVAEPTPSPRPAPPVVVPVPKPVAQPPTVVAPRRSLQQELNSVLKPGAGNAPGPIEEETKPAATSDARPAAIQPPAPDPGTIKVNEDNRAQPPLK
jgi:hypothetical protein